MIDHIYRTSLEGGSRDLFFSGTYSYIDYSSLTTQSKSPPDSLSFSSGHSTSRLKGCGKLSLPSVVVIEASMLEHLSQI